MPSSTSKAALMGKKIKRNSLSLDGIDCSEDMAQPEVNEAHVDFQIV
jgi:hypothetical protein